MSQKTQKKSYIPKDEIKQLSQRSDLVGFLLILHCWGTIIAAAMMFIIWPNPLTFLAAVLIIGGRQLGMAILMHDTAHGILFKTPMFNTFFGQILLAFPIGTDMPVYRKYHLKHHLNTQQENDPDLPLSAPFPISRKSLRRKLLRDLTGMTALKLRIGQIVMMVKNRESTLVADQVFNIKNVFAPYLVNFGMFAICWALGYWWAYFAFWMLPLFTIFQLVLRIRNIAEHAMTSHDKNPLVNARTTKANWVARIFVAPYWVNYHVEHHAYMFVPCWQLKKMHAAMVREGHLPNMETKDSYLEVLRIAAPA